MVPRGVWQAKGLNNEAAFLKTLPMKLFHKIIFWTHLIAGVIAGLVIFLMSFTAVVLMYEPQISEYSERNARWVTRGPEAKRDRKSTRLNSSHLGISYAVFCLKKKKKSRQA